jgi:hypothetical protein
MKKTKKQLKLKHLPKHLLCGLILFSLAVSLPSCKKDQPEIQKQQKNQELDLKQLRTFIQQVQTKQSNNSIARYSNADLELEISREYVTSALEFMLVQRNVVPIETEIRQLEVEMPYYVDVDTPFVSMFQLSDSVAHYKDLIIQDAAQTTMTREPGKEILFTWINVEMKIDSNKLIYILVYQLGKVPVASMNSGNPIDYDVPCGTCLDFGMPVEKPGISCNLANKMSMDFSYYLNLNLNKCYRRKMPCGNYDPLFKDIYTDFKTKYYYFEVNRTPGINNQNFGRGNSEDYAKFVFNSYKNNTTFSLAQNNLVNSMISPPYNIANSLYLNKTFFSTTSISVGPPFTWLRDCIVGTLEDSVPYANVIASKGDTFIQFWASKHKQFFEQTCDNLNVGLYSNLFVPYLIKVYPGIIEQNNEPWISGIPMLQANHILWYPVMACYARASCSQLPAPPKVVIL